MASRQRWLTSFAGVVCLQNPGAGPIDYKSLLILPIRGYQRWISPGIPARCRFYPSCSQYAVEAIREYGVVRGLILGAWRIMRCNPLNYGGYDPVSAQRLFRSAGRANVRGCHSRFGVSD